MALSLVRRIFGTTAARNSLAGMAAGAVRPFVTLFTLPLLAGAVGSDMLGFWLAALAILAIFSCLNTGISSIVVTAIANAEPQATVVRHAILIATICSIFSIALGGAALVLIDVPQTFNLPESISDQMAYGVMIIAILALAIGFPGQIGRYLAIGNLEGHKAQFIEMVALLCGAILLIAAIAMNRNVIALAAAFMLAPQLLILLLGTIYASRKLHEGSIFGKLQPARLLKMVKEAAPMAGHQGMVALNQHGDILIVGILIGPVEAALYGIGQRICVLANYFITPINTAFWPELTTFIARRDTRRIKLYFLSQLGMNFVFALAFAGFIMLFGNTIIGFWMGENFQLSTALLAGLSMGIIAFALTNTMEMLLRAQQDFAFLFRCTIVAVPIALVAKIAVAEDWGSVGVAWVGTSLIILLVGIPYALAIFRSSDLSETFPNEAS